MDDVKGLTVRFPPLLLDQLRQIAEREQRSMNNLIVVALGRFASQYEASNDVTADSPPSRTSDCDDPDDERTRNGPGPQGHTEIAGEGGSVPSCAPSGYPGALTSEYPPNIALSSADTVAARFPAVHQSTPSDGPATAQERPSDEGSSSSRSVTQAAVA